MLHALDPRRAAWAALPGAVRKFVPTSWADKLVFLLRSHHRATCAAPDEPGEGERVLDRSRVPLAPQERLHAIIFCLGNHRLVRPLKPLPAAFGIFKPAIVEGIGEEAIDGTPCQRLIA